MSASDDEETLVPLLSGSPSTTPPRPPPHPTTTTTLPSPPPKRRLPFLSQLLFSFPALSLEALHVFHHTWITKFFVDDVKFPALSFAVLHATERSLGIISYPFMGLLVDRTVLPKQCPGCSGRRRVFFLLWAPLLFVAYLFIWVLPCQLAVTDVAAADAAMHALNSTQLSDINVLHNLDSTSFMKMEPKYFGFIAVAYMVGHFLKSLAPVDLPWMSLGAETTKVTIDRTHLFATKSVVSLIGLGVGSVGPVLLLNNGMVDHFTAFSKYICITGVMLVFSFWLLASRIVPATAQQESKTNMEQKCGVLYENSDVVANGGADSYRQTNLPFVAGIVLCFDNMPYMRLWCVHGLQSLGDVLNEGMFPFFVQYVLKPNHYEAWVSALMLIGYVSGLIATPCWMWISGEGTRSMSREEILRTKLRPLTANDYLNVPQEWLDNKDQFCTRAIENRKSWLSYIDKRAIWLGGWVLNAPTYILGWLLASSGNVPFYCILSAWSGMCYSGTRFLSRPIRADCIDYDQLRTGLRREGAYVMMMEILPQFLRIPSTAFSLGLLTSAGYVAGGIGGGHNQPSDQPPKVKSILIFVIFVIPCVVSLLSFIVALFYPIDDVVHWKIVDSLEKLNAVKALKHNNNRRRRKGEQVPLAIGATRTSVVEPITGGTVSIRSSSVQSSIKKQHEYEKEFAMDSFLLSTVIHSKRGTNTTSSFVKTDVLTKEKLRTAFWFCGIVLGLFLYCLFVNFRSLTDMQETEKIGAAAASKKLMKGHHCMNTVGAVLLISLSVLMFIFHWLRLAPARVLKDMDEVTLRNYIRRKIEMNGTRNEKRKQEDWQDSAETATAQLRVN